MKLPRDLSGDDLISLLCKHWGYARVHQVGSHVVLHTDEPFPQRIAVPAHKAIRIGTLNSIVASVANHKGVPKEEILRPL